MKGVRSLHGSRLCSVSAMLFFLLLDVFFVAEFFPSEVVDISEAGIEKMVFSKVTCPGTARKLLQSPDEGDTNRIGTTCSKYDIVVIQGPTTPLPNGIPTYTVQIMNVNVSGCGISDIHVSCGWFSSARLVNPRVFRRVYYDDCLVNDGDTLGPGESLSFEYSNSFSYPLSVSSVECC